MTFEECFHKEYEPADLQIKQYAENKEGLHIPATVYLEDLKKAFEAGQKGKVVEHFEAYGQCRDSRRIAELKAQIEKMKCCENCNNYCHRIDHRCNTKCKNLSEWEIKENG